MRLLWVCVLLFAASGVFAQSESDDLLPIPVVIEQANLSLTAEGGVSLALVGYLGTGCQFPVEVEQTVNGATLDIRIFQYVPADAICPLMLIMYEDTLTLEPPLGVARVRVNDGQTFDLPGAQSLPDDAFKMVHVEIELESVEIRDDALYLTGPHATPCGFEDAFDIQGLADGWLVLSVYRIEPEEHACAPFLTPFEMTIPLDVLGLEDGQTLAGLTAIEANGLSYFVQTTDAGTQLLPAERDFLQVDSRSVRDSVLSITGTLSDGCDAVLGVLGRQRDDKPVFDVWVYRLLLVEDAERMCPAVLQEHTVTYTFPEDLAPNVYTYNINDGQATGAFVKEEVTVQTMLEERIQRVLHGIDAASASVNADGILILNVTGYIPDGCEALARVNVSQEDTVITVEIYREIPPGIMCPQMIVDYSDSVELGEFPSGDYTIRVNGLEIAFSF